MLIFVIPLWRLISFLGDVNFVMGYVGPVGNVLATGWGTAALIIVGFGCLGYANYRQRSALSTPPEASAELEAGGRARQSLQPLEAESAELQRLQDENQQLQKQFAETASEAGLPPNVATEPRIAHCDFHINDLLRLLGGGFIIENKQFVHCTIRGPGVISTLEDVRPPDHKPENTSLGSGYDPRTLTVKGEPESVLYEILPDGGGISGVIYLVGCTFKNVTFEGVGIAGSPEEIKWWRENAKFEGRGSVGMPRSEIRWEVVREEDDEG